MPCARDRRNEHYRTLPYIAAYCLTLPSFVCSYIPTITLNLIIILLILSNPKYIFNLIGLLFTANYIQQQSNIIGALMAVGSWDKEGIINIVDGQLKRL